MRTPLNFSTEPSVEDSNRPKLRSPDLCRSHQWPFHLRVHPDRWEFVNGEWRLEIERVHLRPGVAGVSGKHGDINSIHDGKLKEAWAEHGDRRWVLVGNGDKRVDPYGFSVMEKIEVCIEENGRLRDGTAIIATWEVIDDGGNIVADNDKLLETSKRIASKLWGLDGPTPAARRRVADGLKKTLDKICSTAAQRTTVSPHLARRIHKLKTMYIAVTGKEYDDGLPQLAPAPAAAAAINPELSLLQQLLALPADERAGLLAALAPVPPPVKQKPRRKKETTDV